MNLEPELLILVCIVLLCLAGIAVLLIASWIGAIAALFGVNNALERIIAFIVRVWNRNKGG